LFEESLPELLWLHCCCCYVLAPLLRVLWFLLAIVSAAAGIVPGIVFAIAHEVLVATVQSSTTTTMTARLPLLQLQWIGVNLRYCYGPQPE
jgi:hypothetical protein